MSYTSPIKLPRRGSISNIINVEPPAEYQFRLGQEHIWFGNFENEGSTLWIPPAYSTTDFIDGERSAKLTTTGAGSVTSTISQRCKIYDNTKKYTLHGWLKTENVSLANISIRFYTSRTAAVASYTDYVTENIIGTNDWTYYYKELNLPTDVFYYEIHLQMTGSTGMTAIALFDNVGLIEWTEWTATADLINIPWPNNYYWIQARTADTPKSMSFSLVERSFGVQRANASNHFSKMKPELNISPNPFNPETIIYCVLPVSGKTTIKIYNIKGQLVKELYKGELEAGIHRFNWDAKDIDNRSVGSGVYFIYMENGKSKVIRKAVLMK